MKRFDERRDQFGVDRLLTIPPAHGAAHADIVGPNLAGPLDFASLKAARQHEQHVGLLRLGTPLAQICLRAMREDTAAALVEGIDQQPCATREVGLLEHF